jgi:hypothetical protein
MLDNMNYKTGLLNLLFAFVVMSSLSCVAQKKNNGFVKIFDGKTLNGWKGDTNYWRVENDCLVGEITPSTLLKTNSFIIWQNGQPADFELKTEFRITKAGNSGINYRSDIVDNVPNALRGYQADIDGANRYTGQNYEERKRTTLAYRGQRVVVPASEGTIQSNVKSNAWTPAQVVGSLGTTDSLKALIKEEGWNECHLVVKGNRLQHFINGVLMSEVTDNDPVNRKLNGMLGVQVHVGPPMKVEYRNIMLKQL